VAIDPTKVLLIRNSNAAWSALSSSVSDWYASARGLLGSSDPTDYYWISFDFGDGTKNTATKRMTDYMGVTNPNFGNVIIGPPNARQNLTIDDGVFAVTGKSTKVTAATVGQALLPALSAVYATHAIQCVLVLPGVPQELYGPFESGAGIVFAQDIEVFLSAATSMNTIPSNGRRGSSFSTYKSGIAAGQLQGPSPYNAQASQFKSAITRPSPLRNLGTWQIGQKLPCGRVGWAISGQSFSTLAEVQSMTNNALARESTDNRGLKVVVGGTAYIFGGGVVNTMAANFAARDMGLTNFGYVSGSPGGIGTNEELLWAAKPAWAGSPLGICSSYGTDAIYAADGITLVSGTANRGRIQGPGGSTLDTWGVMTAIVAPDIYDAAQSSDITWQSGGWAYSWMSAAGMMRIYSLKHGASLAWGTAGEPFANNIGDVDSLFLNLLLGMSGAEATYRAVVSTNGGTGYPYYGPNQYTMAWGDPLYAPYKFNAQQFAQVG
jgi:hypothetical protein